MDPNRSAAQTIIDTNNYTLEYTPDSIKFRYGSGKNSRKDFDIHNRGLFSSSNVSFKF